MGGWDITTQAARPVGCADADHPSAAKIERRRQSDLDFLAWVKVASRKELETALPKVKGWRSVAIQRRLKKVEP